MTISVWANTGEDKVTKDDTRLLDGVDVRNSVWDGTKVSLFGARNEVISFCLIIESPDGETNVEVIAPNWCEVFYVRYLQVQGCSRLNYEHYDERHVPYRMRRVAGDRWEHRPDHDKFYPDIAVPIDLKNNFAIPAGQSRCVWVDIWLPPYTQQDTVSDKIKINNIEIPFTIELLPFRLNDRLSAKTMMYYSTENVNRRYFGQPYIDPGDPLYEQSLKVHDEHHKLAHKHGINLISEHIGTERMEKEWAHRFNGTLYRANNGYDGRAIGLGNDIYSIGTYGTWPWKDEGARGMRRNSDEWVRWFDNNFPNVDYFIYLADESNDWKSLNQWSMQIKRNPGLGRRLKTMATLPAPMGVTKASGIDVVASSPMASIKNQWQNAINKIRERGEEYLILYNGWRPGSGTMVLEDDGVGPRTLGWCQFKHNIPRWFVWESTYYYNYDTGEHTNVFRKAQVFGTYTGRDWSLGETGWNYNNSDGVQFYPGTDTMYPSDTYNVMYPMASLRLKHWRRGLQDHEYLTMAYSVDPDATMEIVNEIIPKVLWELGVTDRDDPTWIMADISWPINPDTWEAARRRLANIIQGN